MDDRPHPIGACEPDELGRILAFPVGRSGTSRRRRRDAPAAQPVRSTLGPERRLTILRASIDGWDAAARRGPDEDVRDAIVSATHDAITALLAGGADDLTLEGSSARPAVVAIFDGPRHAHRALSAATAVHRTLERRGRPRFHARAGVHTASVLDLVVGGEDPMPFRAVGTLYALAERLAEAAAPGEVLLSADTLAHVGSRASARPAGQVSLNDHGEVRDAWSLLGIREEDAT